MEWAEFVRGMPLSKAWIAPFRPGEAILSSRDIAMHCGLSSDVISDRDVAAIDDAISGPSACADVVLSTRGAGNRSFRIRAQKHDHDTTRAFIAVEDVTAIQALEAEVKRARERHLASKLAENVSFADSLHLALSDPLTGLPNRRAFEMAMDEACAAGHFTLCLIDMDGFKNINDRLGHTVGDKVLAAVAARLREHVRATDFVCRIAGDEFAVILPAVANAQDAADAAKRMRAAFNHRLSAGDVDIAVSMTVSVAVVDEPSTREDAFRRADVALHQAKAAAKGAVRVHTACAGGLEAYDNLAAVRKVLQAPNAPLAISERVGAGGIIRGHAVRLAPDAAADLDDQDLFECAACFGVANDLLVSVLSAARAHAKTVAPGTPLFLVLPHAALAHPSAEADIARLLRTEDGLHGEIIIETQAADPQSDVGTTLQRLCALGIARALSAWTLGVGALDDLDEGGFAAVSIEAATLTRIAARRGGAEWMRAALNALPPGTEVHVTGNIGPAEASFALSAGAYAIERPTQQVAMIKRAIA